MPQKSPRPYSDDDTKARHYKSSQHPECGLIKCGRLQLKVVIFLGWFVFFKNHSELHSDGSAQPSSSLGEGREISSQICLHQTCSSFHPAESTEKTFERWRSTQQKHLRESVIRTYPSRLKRLILNRLCVSSTKLNCKLGTRNAAIDASVQ